ncbi:hypothetical protein DMC30DRAFT_446235 [Rhodotorula diobovata]|uniref:C2H2-type domain-containing protein n=1 Tax=Rhodotorula diobovata TaxID=5288 RepID=A0A5C5FYP0_9BASI|nr:hypothetical protein DMC30DRAFT_446235 [Rhodotorula diobovata]
MNAPSSAPAAAPPPSPSPTPRSALAPRNINNQPPAVPPPPVLVQPKTDAASHTPRDAVPSAHRPRIRLTAAGSLHGPASPRPSSVRGASAGRALGGAAAAAAAAAGPGAAASGNADGAGSKAGADSGAIEERALAALGEGEGGGELSGAGARASAAQLAPASTGSQPRDRIDNEQDGSDRLDANPATRRRTSPPSPTPSFSPTSPRRRSPSPHALPRPQPRTAAAQAGAPSPPLRRAEPPPRPGARLPSSASPSTAAAPRHEGQASPSSSGSGLPRPRVSHPIPSTSPVRLVCSLFRQSRARPQYHPHSSPASQANAAGDIAHYRADAARALRQIWPTPTRPAELRQYLAFGGANESPARWARSAPLLQPQETGVAFLRDARLADVLVWLGVEAVTTSLSALENTLVSYLRADTDIIVTRGGTAVRPLHFTAAELQQGLDWELRGQGNADLIADDVDLFLNMLPTGRIRRTKISKASRAHGGEFRRASGTSKKRSNSTLRATPVVKGKAAQPQNAEPTRWYGWWRCGRNGCTYVGRKDDVIYHRGSTNSRAKCLGRCSMGCLFTTQKSIADMRQHNVNKHSERFLCSLETCPFSFATPKARNEHEERHRAGSLWPNGLGCGNSWITEARALSRPVLGEAADSKFPDLSAQNYSRRPAHDPPSTDDDDEPAARRRRVAPSSSPAQAVASPTSASSNSASAASTSRAATSTRPDPRASTASPGPPARSSRRYVPDAEDDIPAEADAELLQAVEELDDDLYLGPTDRAAALERYKADFARRKEKKEKT